MSSQVDTPALKALMMALYTEAIPEQRNPAFREYLKAEIASDSVIDRKVRAFELIAPWLKPGMKILEWGCRQGLMSCFMHEHLKGSVTLFGCDVVNGHFDRFYRYCELTYCYLDHCWRLPYEDKTFDFVLSNGVLEHVANEYESVKEIHRILKDDGIFAVTFLPNIYASTENIHRLLGTGRGHNRLYRKSQTIYDFLRRGFLVEAHGYHQLFPSMISVNARRATSRFIASTLYRYNRPLERVWPINVFSSNVYVILRKVDKM